VAVGMVRMGWDVLSVSMVYILVDYATKFAGETEVND